MSCVSQAVWCLYIDGAARNNPGPAGAGIYLTYNAEPVVAQGFYLGNKTNNQAEYLALLIGLLYVKQYVPACQRVAIYSDSELLVRQLSGLYAIKNKNLQKLVGFVQELLGMIQYTLVHVRRQDNTQADRLANTGIDKKIAVPQEFLSCLLPVL